MLRMLFVVIFFLIYLIAPRILRKKLDWKKTFPEAILKGIVVGLLAAVFETLITEHLSLLIASKIQVVLLAPLIEETLKFYAILFLQKRQSNVRFGCGYGVGLGFGTLETSLRIYMGASLFPEVFPLRTIATMLMHIIAPSVSAFGIRKSIKTDRKRYYLFLGLAVAIHVVFNLVAYHVESNFQR